MYTKNLICYIRNSLAFCPNTIPIASDRVNKTVHGIASLAFTLNLELGLFIIYVYL